MTLEQIANHLAHLRVSSRPDFMELKVEDPKAFAKFIVSNLEQEKRVKKVNLQGKRLFKLVKE